MPMNWWPSDDAVSEVVDSDGPWPSPSPVSTGIFMPFDVDTYDGLAVVVGQGRNRKGREVLGLDEFHRDASGRWQHSGGGAIGWSFRQRWDLEDAREALHLRMEGSSGPSPFDARRRLSYAVFFCGPAVTTVDIARRQRVRTADVSRGPGWLSVLWTPDDSATVIAKTADGRQSFQWNSPNRTA
jgi:hypothetical protein